MVLRLLQIGFSGLDLSGLDSSSWPTLANIPAQTVAPFSEPLVDILGEPLLVESPFFLVDPLFFLEVHPVGLALSLQFLQHLEHNGVVMSIAIVIQ